MPPKIDLKRWNYQLPPREKLLQDGVAALSDAELLAIFLRTGIRGVSVIEFAQQLLAKFGSLYALMNATYDDFCTIHGLGTAKYAQLQASIELSRRFLNTQVNKECFLTNPIATRDFLSHHLSQKDREVFMVLFLDTQNRVIEFNEMFTGTLNHVEIHPREVVRAALKCNASAIILAHNHPSGNPEPSEADKEITDHILDACQMMEIRVLDHIVMGKGRYVSFAERGWI